MDYIRRRLGRVLWLMTLYGEISNSRREMNVKVIMELSVQIYDEYRVTLMVGRTSIDIDVCKFSPVFG